MNTFYELWNTIKPEEAKQRIDEQRFRGIPTNLEEQALSLVGSDIYEILIKDYTMKQWGKHPTELPAFIIKRLPLRFTFNNNYFNDRYQGIPIGGYTSLFKRMLDGIEIKLNVDFLASRSYFSNLASKIIYTGCIDEFFDYEYGRLEYRSLDFQHEVIDIENFQGNAVVNYCDTKYDFTRIIEHKHFEGSATASTVITREFPQPCRDGSIPYYPVNNKNNQDIYLRYNNASKALTGYIFGGRLSEYKYMDMHVVIESAMNRFRSELKSQAA
jgi:UDP-galactopyranose mutase